MAMADEAPCHISMHKDWSLTSIETVFSLHSIAVLTCSRAYHTSLECMLNFQSLHDSSHFVDFTVHVSTLARQQLAGFQLSLDLERITK
jgi:hypothetical protein